MEEVPYPNELRAYTITEVIGRGSYGIVYAATVKTGEPHGGQRVAIKAMNHWTRAHEWSMNEKMKNHPSIVTFYRNFIDKTPLDLSSLSVPYFEGEKAEVQGGKKKPSVNRNYDSYIVMDLYEGTLFNLNYQQPLIPIEEHLAVLLNLARTIEDCHQLGIIHLDLSLLNTLIRHNAKTKEREIALCDFGMTYDYTTTDVRERRNMSFGCFNNRAPETFMFDPQQDNFDDVEPKSLTIDKLIKTVVWAFGVFISDTVIIQAAILSVYGQKYGLDYAEVIRQKLDKNSSFYSLETKEYLRPYICSFPYKINHLDQRYIGYCITLIDPSLQKLASLCFQIKAEKRNTFPEIIQHIQSIQGELIRQSKELI